MRVDPYEEIEESEMDEENGEILVKWKTEKNDENIDFPHLTMKNERDFMWFEMDGDKSTCPIPNKSVHKKDKLVQDYFVYFPYSVPASVAQQCKNGEKMWKGLEEMSKGIRGFDHFEKIIQTYEPFHTESAGLRTSNLPEEWILNLVSKIATLAMRSRELFLTPLPLLRIDSYYRSVSLSQEQIACLLANAFLCCFQQRHDHFFNDFSFLSIHLSSDPISRAKLMFILRYFECVTKEMPTGVITFHRKKIERPRKTPTGNYSWSEEAATVTDLTVKTHGSIFDAQGCLQVDFSSRFIGGGTLTYMALEEEILFLMRPELIVSQLLCEVINDDEAVVIIGAEQFSKCKGYAKSIEYESFDRSISTERDVYGRARSIIVAIDALELTKRGQKIQYENEWVEREVNKAYVGFAMHDSESHKRPIATGNWGCVTLNGDKELKSLIQLVAASKAGRPVIYYTSKDKELAEKIEKIHRKLRVKKISIGQVFQWILNYNNETEHHKSAIDYIKKCIKAEK